MTRCIDRESYSSTTSVTRSPCVWPTSAASFPEHFGERVRWELRRFYDVVINTGVCGECSGGLRASLESRVLRFHPDVVLVLIGMNDALAGRYADWTRQRGEG